MPVIEPSPSSSQSPSFAAMQVSLQRGSSSRVSLVQAVSRPNKSQKGACLIWAGYHRGGQVSLLSPQDAAGWPRCLTMRPRDLTPWITNARLRAVEVGVVARMRGGGFGRTHRSIECAGSSQRPRAPRGRLRWFFGSADGGVAARGPEGLRGCAAGRSLMCIAACSRGIRALPDCP